MRIVLRKFKIVVAIAFYQKSSFTEVRFLYEQSIYYSRCICVFVHLIIQPSQLPVGLVMPLIGAPFFIL